MTTNLVEMYVAR